MLLPPGHAFLEKVSEDETFILARARRDSDGVPLLVKAPLSKYPSPRLLRALEHEYRLADKLESAWALKPLSLERFPEGMALVLEDFDGVPLDSLAFPLEMGKFLTIAIRLAAAIASMHERGLVHKDLKPSNLFVKEDPAALDLKLTGFGLASLLPSEDQSLRPLSLLEGTLPYMSPEQTGRMNRNLDSRSDLYACGVILYQLLTGVLPCEGKDALEWVYCQVALPPKPPVERNQDIPQVLSNLVLKLLAKEPEERYQTATSLEADLDRCLAQWKSQGRLESFPLGERDVSERFLIPQRLYGRDQEIVDLLKAYERVAALGKSEFMLVSGYSGIGKTSLVKELYQPILRDRAFFLAGKFDQFQRDIPYSTIVQAFRECVQQLLTESAEKVAEWKAKLQAAVGINGQLIVDVIPQVELIIGTQPPVLELPLTEAQNRFDLVFRNFLGVFAQPEHPLVLFLDDLQWADSASLKLIRTLITDPDTRYLFLIGAYRDNEVGPTHPLTLTLEELRKDGAAIREIVLLPLSLRDLNRLIADSLHEEAVHTESLAALVYEKTGGNPFFFVQFLKNLHREALMRFDRSKAAWTWNLAAIEAMGFTDNVVDFLIEKLKKLPSATQGTLKLFACAGNRADAAVLAAICQEQESEIARDLGAAIEEGLVLRAEDTYRFLHDRIQQAAYSLISEEERVKTHLRIGRLLATRENLEEGVFDIVSQYDLGASLILDPEEQRRVAELNLMAGRKAKDSSAYLPALAYLSAGIAILPGDAWEDRYPLLFALHFEKAECEYLTGNFEETERLLFLLLAKARDDLDKATVYRLMVDFYTTTDDIEKAIESGMQCLALFGIELSVHPSREELVAAHDEVWKNLGGREIEELLDLPLMTSREMRIVLDILSVLKTSVLYTDLNLFGLIGCVSVNISLRFGNADASTMGYALFGSTLGSHFGDYRNGYRFGKLAYDLVEKNGYRNYQAKIAMEFGDMVNFWTHPLLSDLPYLKTGFLAAVETGDLSYACFCCAHIVTLLLVLGLPLEEVWQESRKKLDFVRKFRYEAAADVIISIQRLIQNLRGLTANFSTFSGDGFDQELFEVHLREKGPTFIICWYYTLKLQARFLSGDYEEAIAAGLQARDLVWSMVAHVQFPEFHFYFALALAARSEAGDNLDSLLELQALYREWAENSPENYSNRFDLISAEIARLQENELAAEHLYEQAVRSARENGFVQNEGIANELAARFYLKRGFKTIARAYLQEACYCYLKWGAEGKVRQLERLYPQLLGRRTGILAEALGTRAEQLDMLAVIKASQAVSGEILLSKLVDTLLRIAIEQAGGQKGLMLFPQAVETEKRNFPRSIVNYVRRTKEKVILDDASAPNMFSTDPYLIENLPKSILCLPIMRQAELIGILYLENDLLVGAFTSDRIAFLELIGAQSAISLENAKLYENLRESEEQFRHLVEYSPIAIALSTQAGTIRYLNRAFVDTFGYTIEDLPDIRAWWLRAYPDEEYRRSVMEKWGREVKSASLKGENTAPAPYKVSCKDGTVRFVEITGVSIGDKLLVLFSDITERKQAEDELKRLNETLEQKVLERTAQVEKANASLKQADRLKDEFLSAISHELRSPLNAITGFGSILEDEVLGPLNDQQHESLSKLLKSSDRMLSLINDLLDFAKIRAGRFELSPRETEYGPLVDEVLARMGALAGGKRIALDALIDVPIKVYLDPQRIVQVLTNLVSNSIKFTPPEGRIRIRAFVEGNTLVTEVRDTGIGIEPADLSQLFTPFKQLGAGLAQKAGTGLGLSICKGIVEAHGGTLSAESPGLRKGSTFRFSLPLERERSPIP